ncbi:hypothetical protein EJ04DRAFT_521568 [Polyplosphaeria fusca]|uniref:Uncharacterized protein n=1 Tax=Polyplosphaeria fusca TaxID=682080 RepID=A0A9P4V610_9PLEO|nr:hypothetical protein EJ04DRAFT_521568 [Polyplosphaeria fusca]
MHILIIFSVLPFFLPTWAQGGNNPLPLPAVSFDTTQWYFNHDQNTTDRASDILKAPGNKRLKRSYFLRDGLRPRQNDGVDTELLAALGTGFQQLFQDNQLVEQVANNIAGNPIPGDFAHIERVPAFEDVTLAASYLFVIPVAAARAPAQVPRDNISWLTASILSMVWVHLTDPQNQDHLRQAFSVPRRGIVQNGCPPKDRNECANQLCQGTDEVCQYQFLQGCACTNTCPVASVRHFVCDEEQCGGSDDTATGKCKGVSRACTVKIQTLLTLMCNEVSGGDNPGKNKGCFCVNFDDDEPYIWSRANLNALQKMIDAGRHTPDPPKDDLRCKTRENSGPAYIAKEAMESHRDAFCRDLTKNGDAQSPDFMALYDEKTYQGATLGIKSDGKFSYDTCLNYFDKIIYMCIARPDNPMDWKYGGEYEDGGTLFSMVPSGYATVRWKEEGGGPISHPTVDCRGRKADFKQIFLDEFWIRGRGFLDGDTGEAFRKNLIACMAEWGASDSDGLTGFEFYYYDKIDPNGNEWVMFGKSWTGSFDRCYERVIKEVGGPQDAKCFPSCDSYKCGT